MIELRDGSRVEIRALGADDKEALADGFERLSALSRYRRFLSATDHLTKRQLAYLTEIDHHDHEALVAIDGSSRDGVGVARYVRSSSEPAEAEFAVAVADDWQRRGLGTLLVGRLAGRAREEGIDTFTALILADNPPVRHILDALGTVHERAVDANTIEISLELPELPAVEEAPRLAEWMRAAATGQIASGLSRERTA